MIDRTRINHVLIFFTCLVVFFFLGIGDVKAESFKLDCVCIEGCDGAVSDFGGARKFPCSYSRENINERGSQLGGGFLLEQIPVGKPSSSETNCPAADNATYGENSVNGNVLHDSDHCPIQWFNGPVVLSFCFGILAAFGGFYYFTQRQG